MKNKWKTIAIIFIILFTLETLVFGWAYVEGVDYHNDRFMCSILCANDDSFLYNPDTEMCLCYQGDDIVYSESLK